MKKLGENITKSRYSDKEIVDGLLRNDKSIIEYFFYEGYTKLFRYIAFSIFDNKVDIHELISELFLYLADNNWHKVRQFTYGSTLSTWVTVVATRFFLKKREELIENESSEYLIFEQDNLDDEFIQHSDSFMDVHDALDKMTNKRYAFVIEKIDLQGVPMEDVATQLNVSIANLYNIHHRALLQLKSILTYKKNIK